MRFGISVVVSLCVVVHAPTGPGASFSETPFSRNPDGKPIFARRNKGQKERTLMQPIINRQKELKAHFYAQGNHKQKLVTYTDDAVLVNKQIVAEYSGTGEMVWVDKDLEKAIKGE